MLQRRGQALVEVVALAPVVVAATAAFALGATRLAAMAKAEAALADAIAIDAADGPLAGRPLRDGRIVRLTPTTITVTVPAPLGAVTQTGQRAR